MGQSNERKGMFDHKIKRLVGKGCGNPKEEGRVFGELRKTSQRRLKFREHRVREFRSWAERKPEGEN